MRRTLQPYLAALCSLLLISTAQAAEVGAEEVRRSDTQARVTADNMTPAVGEHFTITATFDNTSTASGGPFDVFNASLTVEFPIALDIVSVGTIDHGTCSSGAGSVGCSFVSFPAGGVADLEIVLAPTEAGDFTVTVTVSHPDFDPNSGNNTATKVINVALPGSISGLKFHDVNGDGAKDPTEPGLEGWQINLGDSGGGTSSTTTGADGTYTFSALNPGTYSVTETLQTNWVMSFPTTAYSAVEVTAGQDTPNIDFGNYQFGSICGGKYRDLNADGVLSSIEKAENPVSGWRIDLFAPGESVAGQSATTAPDGTYCFTELAPGTYTLTEETRPNWVKSSPVSGAITVVLGSGETATDRDFANYPTGSIEVFKFNDLDANGVEDIVDLPLAGVEMRLTTVQGNEMSQTTETDGFARFETVPAGSAQLFEMIGAARGSSTGGTIVTTATETAAVFSVEIPIGETLTVIVGNYTFGSISGRKWHDLDRDGTIDSEEPLLDGWTIELYKDGELTGTRQTVVGGAYDFPGLIPGNYEVREVILEGWEQTFPFLATGSNVHPLTVLSGQNHEDINFGNLGPPADLAVVKSAPTVVSKGQIFSFVVDVSNVGELPLAEVTMQDVLDTANFEFVRFSGDGTCTHTTGTVDCTYGTLGVGESRQTIIRVRAIGIGNETNTATGTTTTPEASSENNASEVELLIEYADVAVDKTVSDATIEVDDQTVFTIVVSNVGNAEADGVGMQDVVPDALEILNIVASKGDCVQNGQTIDCAFGPLDAGETRTVTVTVKGLVLADVTNTATASTTSEDVHDINNIDAVQVRIGLLRLSVTYVEDTCVAGPDGVADGVSDGNLVDVTITVTNLTQETQAYQLVLSDGIRTTPVEPSLSGTVAPEASDVKTFRWRTEGLSWLGPRDPRETPFVFEILLKRGERLSDSQRDEIKILPKPLILVHGVLSNADTWSTYPALAKAAHAYWEGRTHAVNSMDTGLFPEGELNLLTLYTETTIDDNARALHAELEAFRRRTKSCKVDIVAHSMGGLISRSYIDTFMADDTPVANLMQLGTPNEGSSCAEPGLALSKILFKERSALAPYPMNFYQLTPTYLRNVFNRIRADQKGIPFHVIAGALHPVSASLGTLATVCLKPEFGDGLVSVESAWALLDGVPAFATTTSIALNHIALTGSAAVFQGFVVPIASGGVTNAPAARLAAQAPSSVAVDLTKLTGLRIGGSSNVSSFPVGSSSALHVTVLMDSGTHVRLFDPMGVTAASTDTLASRLSPFVSISVQNPTAGDWTLDFSRAASDSTSVGYAIGLEGSDLSMAGDAQVSGESITVSATLTGAWTAPSVSARLVGTSTEQEVTLTETGTGLYETSVASTEMGPHLVVISAVAGSETRLALATADVGVVGISVEPAQTEIPETTHLGAGFPNPTDATITFPLALERSTRAQMHVVDVTGRIVLRIPPREYSAGHHKLEVNTSRLANGTYVLIGQIAGVVSHRQFVVIR